MSASLKWGIIGTGGIAKTFVKGLAGSKTGKLVAVGSRSKEKADKFADEFKIAHRHASYESLLADENVQAVYIATPHPQHAEWAIKAAEAGKHLLVEKPIGLNWPEAMAVIEAARAHDVFLMEAFMYRCHPQTQKLVELLHAKTIGDVRLIQATFSFHWPKPLNTDSRLTNNSLGGGGILDVGCYPVSMARLIAGVAMGKDFAEPTEFKAVGHVGAQSRVDEYAAASVKFPGGILAQLACGVQVGAENVVRIFGSDGSITIPSPWIPARDGGQTKIIVNAGSEQVITIDTPEPLYALEADTVARYVEQRQSPTMSWADTLGNMRALDQWRQQIGLIYDAEKPDAYTHTVARRPLTVRAKHNMKYGKIAGIDKPISRLVMGVDSQDTMPHAAIMFDDFYERGGNTFDTAYVYGPAKSINLGRWIAHHKVRDNVVVISKGAHTPFCDPKSLSRELKENLERLRLDYVDIFLMHRDNPAIPVGEFVDVLNEHKAAGRTGVFGGSNWELDRIDEANDYANTKGLQGFGIVSNQFSLARMVAPPWGGCMSASDVESRRWFTKRQLPLFPWSSQARGFFTERAAPDNKSDAELVRCWYADDNWQRRDRVLELAKKRNALPIQIALAYVLHQPFPTFPLIGPRMLEETRTSLPALDIELSEQEVKWLNLEG